jgi:hypothetical protein
MLRVFWIIVGVIGSLVFCTMALLEALLPNGLSNGNHVPFFGERLLATICPGVGGVFFIYLLVFILKSPSDKLDDKQGFPVNMERDKDNKT